VLSDIAIPFLYESIASVPPPADDSRAIAARQWVQHPTLASAEDRAVYEEGADRDDLAIELDRLGRKTLRVAKRR